jgi:hypothetical protein
LAVVHQNGLPNGHVRTADIANIVLIDLSSQDHTDNLILCFRVAVIVAGHASIAPDLDGVPAVYAGIYDSIYVKSSANFLEEHRIS